MTDRLTLARALEGGGIARDAAEHIATQIFDAIHDNVATKSDLQSTETALRNDLQSTEAALRNDLQSSEAALRNDLQSTEAALRAQLGLIEHRLLTRVGSMVVVATGILVAIHYIR